MGNIPGWSTPAAPEAKEPAWYEPVARWATPATIGLWIWLSYIARATQPWPWSDLRFNLVGSLGSQPMACSHRVDAGADDVAFIGWCLLILALGLSLGNRPSAKPFAAAAAAAGLLSANIYGTKWLEGSLLGTEPLTAVAGDCRVLSPEQLQAFAERELYYRSIALYAFSLLLLGCLAVLLPREDLRERPWARGRQLLRKSGAGLLAVSVLLWLLAVWGLRSVHHDTPGSGPLPSSAMLLTLVSLSFLSLLPLAPARALGRTAAGLAGGIALAQYTFVQQLEYARSKLVTTDAAQFQSEYVTGLSSGEVQLLHAAANFYLAVLLGSGVVLAGSWCTLRLLRPRRLTSDAID